MATCRLQAREQGPCTSAREESRRHRMSKMWTIRRVLQHWPKLMVWTKPRVWIKPKVLTMCDIVKHVGKVKLGPVA